MCKRVSEKCSIELQLEFRLSLFLHYSVNEDQWALLKLKKFGGEEVWGISSWIFMGKWSDPWVSSRTDQSKYDARSGLQRVKSTEVVFKVCGIRYVGEVVFKIQVFVWSLQQSYPSDLGFVCPTKDCEH